MDELSPTVCTFNIFTLPSKKTTAWTCHPYQKKKKIVFLFWTWQVLYKCWRRPCRPFGPRVTNLDLIKSCLWKKKKKNCLCLKRGMSWVQLEGQWGPFVYQVQWESTGCHVRCVPPVAQLSPSLQTANQGGEDPVSALSWGRLRAARSDRHVGAGDRSVCHLD